MINENNDMMMNENNDDDDDRPRSNACNGRNGLFFMKNRTKSAETAFLFCKKSYETVRNCPK